MIPSRISMLALLHLSLAVALIGGCASGPSGPVYDESTIVAAEQAGDLVGLFDRISADLANPDLAAKARPALEARQAEVGRKIAEGVGEQVQQALAQAPRVVDVIPVDELERARTLAAGAEPYDTATFQALQAELDAHFDATNAAIAERKTAIESLGETQVAERLRILDELPKLVGPTHADAAAYATEREQVLVSLEANVTTAVAEEDWDTAREMLEVVQEVSPGDAETAEQLVTVNTKAFERDFWLALEKGQPAKAYGLLTEVAASDAFASIQPRLASSKDAMADYYVSLGSEATTAGRLAEAYERFMQAREIRRLLGEEEPGLVEAEKPFVTALEAAYKTARSADQMGLAWGYLKVITHMAPTTPQLRRNLRETRELVLQRAIKRLSAAPFEDKEDAVAEYGEAVGSKVVQYLFETIPNDVRIIEREQLSDILREREISGGAEGGGLAAADYLVQGTILEAKVDSDEKTGSKTMRVVTEQEERPNPEYDAWINLSSKQRERTPQPPKTVTVPRKEDVRVAVTVHRKVGLFSTSYRVIDAASAKVLFADSVRARVEHEDTSSEGVELGDFQMEFKMAALPSDIEILDELADQIAEKIGGKLAEVLAAPEKAYADSATRLVREGNYEEATRSYAYAIVLSERKDADVGELIDGLRASAVESASR